VFFPVCREFSRGQHLSKRVSLMAPVSAEVSRRRGLTRMSSNDFEMHPQPSSLTGIPRFGLQCHCHTQDLSFQPVWHRIQWTTKKTSFPGFEVSGCLAVCGPPLAIRLEWSR